MTSARTAAQRPRPRPRPRPPARRRKKRAGRMAGLWAPLLVVVVAVVGLSWDTDSQGVPPVAGRCTVAGSALTITNEQAANAATIAAVARSRGLPERATVIALATAQQESRLRNLAYGDRDSLGLFQQRPSQGWGSPEQVQDPVYATGKFLDGLVEVPGWETGRLTEVAQTVQRSGFPEAYQQWEEMGTTLAGALLATTPAALSCTYSPPQAAGPVDDRAAAVADVVRREAGSPTVQPGGVVQVGVTGWPEVTWAVAHAQNLQLTEVQYTNWRWTPADGWSQDAADDVGAVLRLQLAV
ncbi:hypothetical protein [Klenkia sp. PcliD-1-E]|uniref:hypothetical protein n=1 Tax=Klenkia sp. PcliD-1-E TaxID=2954492 RepID=UPI00209751C3|nr:hypothetical protein [Klenkia sp. PcliD-1-E]MCO7219324.1 hypothetical protein [Klenkia sp. PcliD-1-E]